MRSVQRIFVPDSVHAVIAIESGYRATAQSHAGAQGLMQLMPGTQRDLGVADALDPGRTSSGVAHLRASPTTSGPLSCWPPTTPGPGAVFTRGSLEEFGKVT